MSCFESSTFLKDPAKMNQEVLIEACKKLGLNFSVTHGVLIVMNAGQTEPFHREFLLMVSGNIVSYNTYHTNKGKETMLALQKQFQELHVEYAVQSTLKAFEGTGFHILPDWSFEPDEKTSRQFFMVAQSDMPGEDDATSIRFSILNDGTIVSDSNYIPHDVHELADRAFFKIDQFFGSTRREGVEIKRKPIPAKYQGKTYCSASKSDHKELLEKRSVRSKSEVEQEA